MGSLSQMNEEKEPYVPTPEELKGESWAYCYGCPPVIAPPPTEEKD
jgi:hypothetical protein